jgi:hypothetical protein
MQTIWRQEQPKATLTNCIPFVMGSTWGSRSGRDWFALRSRPFLQLHCNSASGLNNLETTKVLNLPAVPREQSRSVRAMLFRELTCWKRTQRSSCKYCGCSYVCSKLLKHKENQKLFNKNVFKTKRWSATALRSNRPSATLYSVTVLLLRCSQLSGRAWRLVTG